ncbi:200 kDa antigen p200, putative [Burkholderia pseudomallei 1710b]|uniref:200 kDa antigen p200, putative n=1 Tax=Burkholderia pseudomallei (strain 1710b) TaxID=320372 RepID=Q3JTA2_BURP1|nr:200 kDa antigen p200, putative [Burkholderia pseudomallei 1710b]
MHALASAASAPSANDSRHRVSARRISVSSRAARRLHGREKQREGRAHEAEDREHREHVEVREDRRLRHEGLVQLPARRLQRGGRRHPRERCDRLRVLPQRIVEVLRQRRQVRRQMRHARLRALANQRGRQRNADRSRDIAEHREKRGRIVVQPARHGQIRERRDRHEQEADRERLRAAYLQEVRIVDVGHERVRVHERRGEQQEAEAYEKARLHVRHQLADDRNLERDEERAWRQHETREHRRVAEPLLRELRHEHGAAVQHDRERRDRHAAEREIAILQARQIDDGLFRVEQPERRADEPRDGQHRERADERRREPVLVLAAIEHHLQTAEADRDQRDADVVDRQAARAAAFPRRILDELDHRERSQHADRHVEQEHPAPREVVGDPAAERRAEHRRDDDRHGRDRERAVALLGRERIEDDRLLVRLQAAAEQPLQHAEHDQLAEIGCDSAQERADRERDDAQHEVALAAEQAAEKAGDRQHDAVGDKIRRERPGRFVVARRHRAGDVRQRDVDDRRVEHLHERGERDDDRDQPRVRGGTPRAVAVAVAVAARCGGRGGRRSVHRHGARRDDAAPPTAAKRARSGAAARRMRRTGWIRCRASRAAPGSVGA